MNLQKFAKGYGITGLVNRYKHQGGYRAEELPGNIADLKPVDMGTNVLWSDKYFTLGGSEYVNIDELLDMFIDKETGKYNTRFLGWRLPFQSELEELIKKVNVINTENDDNTINTVLESKVNGNKLVLDVHGVLEPDSDNYGGISNRNLNYLLSSDVDTNTGRIASLAVGEPHAIYGFKGNIRVLLYNYCKDTMMPVRLVKI